MSKRTTDPAPPFTTRFAPSPTGRLHLGSAFSAMVAHDAARAAGGRFLVRIEDTDFTRCRPAYEAAILEDLAWLGLTWDPPLWRQSERRALYDAALETLIARGLVYRCFRTRKELMAGLGEAPHGSDPAPFMGEPLPAEEEAQRLEEGQAFAWRLSLAACRAALGPDWGGLLLEEEGRDPVPLEPQRLGDAVLARKDIGVSYHLAACYDDAASGVTHVIRGEDLRDSAHLHRLLQGLLGWPAPVYRHHRLILGPSGERLAKRDQAQAIASLRAAGAAPAEIRATLGL